MLAIAAKWGFRAGLLIAATIAIAAPFDPHLRYYVGTSGAIILGISTALLWGVISGLVVFALVLLARFARRRH